MRIDKLKYFIHLVEKERTGSPAELAEKLEVTERTIYAYVYTLKHELKAPIEFNKYRRTYCFERPGKLHWKWVKHEDPCKIEH